MLILTINLVSAVDYWDYMTRGTGDLLYCQLGSCGSGSSGNNITGNGITGKFAQWYNSTHLNYSDVSLVDTDTWNNSDEIWGVCNNNTFLDKDDNQTLVDYILYVNSTNGEGGSATSNNLTGNGQTGKYAQWYNETHLNYTDISFVDTDTWNTSQEMFNAANNGTFYPFSDNPKAYYNSTIGWNNLTGVPALGNSTAEIWYVCDNNTFPYIETFLANNQTIVDYILWVNSTNGEGGSGSFVYADYFDQQLNTTNGVTFENIKLTGTINDTNDLYSINSNNRVLYGADGTTAILDWTGMYNNGIPFSYDIPTVTFTIDDANLRFVGGSILDNNGVTSISSINRALYYTDGTTISLDWSNGILQDIGNAYSVHYGNRILYASDGTTEQLDWANSGTGVEISQSYYLPNTDGNNGEVMTTDGAGIVSWQSVSGGSFNISGNGVTGKYAQWYNETHLNYTDISFVDTDTWNSTADFEDSFLMLDQTVQQTVINAPYFSGGIDIQNGIWFTNGETASFDYDGTKFTISDSMDLGFANLTNVPALGNSTQEMFNAANNNTFVPYKGATSNVNLTDRNLTDISVIRLTNNTGACDLTLSGSICKNATGMYIVG